MLCDLSELSFHGPTDISMFDMDSKNLVSV